MNLITKKNSLRIKKMKLKDLKQFAAVNDMHAKILAKLFKSAIINVDGQFLKHKENEED